MINSKNISADSEKLKIVQESWLLFYNNFLFEKGCITQSEYNKMIIKIKNRPPVPLSKKAI